MVDRDKAGRVVTMVAFKGVLLYPDSYEVQPGEWRAHIFMRRQHEREPLVSAVSALRHFESERAANALALSWARMLVVRDTWANGRHPSSEIDGRLRPFIWNL